MALGAARRRVVLMVMREAGMLLVTGAVIGSLITLVAGRAVSSLLYGVKPYDVFTLGTSILLLAAIALVAGFLPARRAATVDPMEALRYE
jgi:ABC-type antimicrobial peptide transport system permease subunit